jgi:hypothetical protein
MSNAKILHGVCAALVLGISFPIAGQANTYRHHLDGRAHFGTAPPRYYRIYRGKLVRHPGSAYYGAGAYSGLHRRGVSSWRFGSYGDWRQSYSPYWGWDVAASLLATTPAYDSYYFGGYEGPADAGAVAYCVQRFRSTTDSGPISAVMVIAIRAHESATVHARK